MIEKKEVTRTIEITVCDWCNQEIRFTNKGMQFQNGEKTYDLHRDCLVELVAHALETQGAKKDA